MLKFVGKKIFTIYAENFCLSKPVFFSIKIFVLSQIKQHVIQLNIQSTVAQLVGC